MIELKNVSYGYNDSLDPARAIFENVNKTNEIYYDVRNGRWLSYSERWASELGHLASRKLGEANKKSGIFEQ